MLDECLEFLEKKSNESQFTYEVIIVSDGSTDKTVEVGNTYSKKYSAEKVRVLALETNRGKGGAVRLVCIYYTLATNSYFFIVKGNAKC